MGAAFGLHHNLFAKGLEYPHRVKVGLHPPPFESGEISIFCLWVQKIAKKNKTGKEKSIEITQFFGHVPIKRVIN